MQSNPETVRQSPRLDANLQPVSIQRIVREAETARPGWQPRAVRSHRNLSTIGLAVMLHAQNIDPQY